jgi:hypothetical protein
VKIHTFTRGSRKAISALLFAGVYSRSHLAARSTPGSEPARRTAPSALSGRDSVHGTPPSACRSPSAARPAPRLESVTSPELSAGGGYEAEGARRRPLPPVLTTNRRESHHLAAGQGGQGDGPSHARKGRLSPGSVTHVISGGVITSGSTTHQGAPVCPHPDPGAICCPVSTRSRIPNSIRRIIG